MQQKFLDVVVMLTSKWFERFLKPIHVGYNLVFFRRSDPEDQKPTKDSHLYFCKSNASFFLFTSSTSMIIISSRDDKNQCREEKI